MPPPTDSFWKSKLAAYLHDPPSKCFDLRSHEEVSKKLFRQAGFVDEMEYRRISETYAKGSDWTASSADRFPFPRSRGNLSSVFDGKRAQFHHPLSPEKCLAFHAPFVSTEAAQEIEETLQPVFDAPGGWTQEDLWRARFFCHWRLWEPRCVEKDYRFGFLPADTRIPDHTIWNHMQVVSALNSCADGTGLEARLRPAFLKFQLGPVQDFIAEARSVRDLWSGSYLLSWLMAAGLKALAMEAGPDAVVYPSLKEQPLFDLHLRDSMWSQIRIGETPVWKSIQPSPAALLTPNLPNVFLAVVHLDDAERLGKRVEEAIRSEWGKIADAVWQFAEHAEMTASEAGMPADLRKQRFTHQVAHFLSMSWQVTPWPDSLDDALALAARFAPETPVHKAAETVTRIVKYATETMPLEDRDGRYYEGFDKGPKTKLNNIGLAWSVILAFNSWQLDGTRQVRAFPAWASGGWDRGVSCNKDSLGGKAEAVAGGASWQEKASKLGNEWKPLFKHQDWVGASTLIKRLWHLAYLKKTWDLPCGHVEFRMPNTHDIAAGKNPEDWDDTKDDDKDPGESYFAVLAVDGDQIGKWVSGEKTPKIGDQLSAYTDAGSAQPQGARPYFTSHGGESLLEGRRPLSPSYHLQFSQALSNFALQCARRVVEAHQGKLIYAGGDDVLAMLPADTALACAAALRAAFQGRETPGLTAAGLKSPAPGYLAVAKDSQSFPIPLVLPGPEAEVSAGVVIAHCKSPLQDAVRAAQAAEKRAKAGAPAGLGRAAVAVTLMKRSGEITQWGTKWDSGGLELYQAVLDAMHANGLSSKFPHRVCQLLAPYLKAPGSGLADAADFDAAEVIRREFEFALSRQSTPSFTTDQKNALLEKLSRHLEATQDAGTQPLLANIDGLLTAVAFAHRTSGPSTHSPSAAQ